MKKLNTVSKKQLKELSKYSLKQLVWHLAQSGCSVSGLKDLPVCREYKATVVMDDLSYDGGSAGLCRRGTGMFIESLPLLCFICVNPPTTPVIIAT